MNIYEVFLVSQVEEEELPALELIEDSEASCLVQVLPLVTDLVHIHTTTAFDGFSFGMALRHIVGFCPVLQHQLKKLKIEHEVVNRILIVSIGLDLIDYECTAININKPNGLCIECMTIFFFSIVLIGLRLFNVDHNLPVEYNLHYCVLDR